MGARRRGSRAQAGPDLRVWISPQRRSSLTVGWRRHSVASKLHRILVTAAVTIMLVCAAPALVSADTTKEATASMKINGMHVSSAAWGRHRVATFLDMLKTDARARTQAVPQPRLPDSAHQRRATRQGLVPSDTRLPLRIQTVAVSRHAERHDDCRNVLDCCAGIGHRRRGLHCRAEPEHRHVPVRQRQVDDALLRQFQQAESGP